jgi:peptide/nickel transport system ATP-binding protein
VRGRIAFEGRNLLELKDEQMRGRKISLIFQEPMTSLNHILAIGLQITEPLQIHLGMTDEQAQARAVELVTQVGITDTENRLKPIYSETTFTTHLKPVCRPPGLSGAISAYSRDNH